jgi:hypothetical protein
MGLFYYNTGFSKSRINVIFLESAVYGIEMKRTLKPMPNFNYFVSHWHYST